MTRDIERSAESIAEIVEPDTLPLVRKEVAGVQLVVTKIFISIAVEPLPTSSGHDVNNAVSVAAGIRAVIGFLDFDLLDGFHRRKQIEPTVAGSVHRQT